MVEIFFATYADLLLAPIYLLLFYFIVRRVKNKHYKDDPFLARNIMLGFWLKTIAAILYVLLIQFYYGFGDSFNFHAYGRIMHGAILDDFSNIEFLNPFKTEPFYNYVTDVDVFSKYDLLPGYMQEVSNQFIVKMDCFLGFLCFQNYTVISLMFSLLSFIGIWKVYVVLDKIFHKYRKEVAFSFLFLPSFVFWSSGILKESVCLFALGITCSYIFNWLYFGKFSFRKLLLTIFYFYIIFLVKNYILMSLLSALGVILMLRLDKKVHFGIKVLLFPIVAISLFFILSAIIEQLVGQAVEDVAQDLVTQSLTSQKGYEEKGGSFVGTINLNPTMGSIASSIPTVLNTVFFRPYLWEAGNPVMLLSALESVFFMLLFLRLLLTSKIIFLLGKISKSPIFVFSFVFAIMLGAIVGFTTFNFGTIVRYKMPCLPFLSLALLICYKYKKEDLILKKAS